jgi:drug/metabolite transporter (DMT)-like permease
LEGLVILTSKEIYRPQKIFTPVLAAFLFLVLISGGASVAIRFSYAELPTFWSAGLRFGSATVIFWVLVAIRSAGIPRGKALLASILYGALGIGGAFPLMYWGLERTPASLHQIIIALVPLLTLFFAFFHRLEALRLRNLIGAILAFSGIVIAFGGAVSGDISIVRLLGLVVAAGFMAEAGVIIKKFSYLDPIAVSAIASTVGTAIIVVVSIIARETWTFPTTPGMWWLLAYLSIGTSVITFILYLYVLKRWTATATSYSMVLIPLVTVVLATWLAGERITWLFVIGGGLVLAGVWFGALMKNRVSPN